MKKLKLSKRERQNELKNIIGKDPFITDENLASKFNVSIQTIRLDRLELNIPELRQRVKQAAETNYQKVRSISGKEIVGELIDLNLDKSGISVLETDETMIFKKTNIVRGHHIFSQAESLAMAVIDTDVALTGVSNINI